MLNFNNKDLFLKILNLIKILLYIIFQIFKLLLEIRDLSKTIA